jgi:hypothetical protein
MTAAARAFVFEFDGTLVASSGFDGALYIEAVREVLGDVDIDPTYNLIGTRQMQECLPSSCRSSEQGTPRW